MATRPAQRVTSLHDTNVRGAGCAQSPQPIPGKVGSSQPAGSPGAERRQVLSSRHIDRRAHHQRWSGREHTPASRPREYGRDHSRAACGRLRALQALPPPRRGPRAARSLAGSRPRIRATLRAARWWLVGVHCRMPLPAMPQPVAAMAQATRVPLEQPQGARVQTRARGAPFGAVVAAASPTAARWIDEWWPVNSGRPRVHGRRCPRLRHHRRAPVRQRSVSQGVLRWQRKQGTAVQKSSPTHFHQRPLQSSDVLQAAAVMLLFHWKHHTETLQRNGDPKK